MNMKRQYEETIHDVQVQLRNIVKQLTHELDLN
jgi:hypothetical protein